MPHADDAAPRDIRITFPQLFAELRGRLAENGKAHTDCQLVFERRIELLFRKSGAQLVNIVNRIGNMPETFRIIGHKSTISL